MNFRRTIAISVLSSFILSSSGVAAGSPAQIYGARVGNLPLSASNPTGGMPTGEGGDYLLRDEMDGLPRGSEYVSGYLRGVVMMEVNLWGAVEKPGLHHIPMGMDLVQFISLAGGPNSGARLDKVTIKRQTKEKGEIIEVNVEELAENPDRLAPKLEPNDIIIIPERRPLVSSDVLTTVGLVSGILGATVSIIFISTQLKSN